MDRFRKQCLQLGSIKGWRHMSFYLRGKEELCVTVYHQNTAAESANLMDGRDHGHVLEPEPECLGEADAQPDEAKFLLAGYEKYGRPYVWLRSGCIPTQVNQPDGMPLSLETTEQWARQSSSVTVRPTWLPSPPLRCSTAPHEWEMNR